MTPINSAAFKRLTLGTSSRDLCHMLPDIASVNRSQIENLVGATTRDGAYLPLLLFFRQRLSQYRQYGSVLTPSCFFLDLDERWQLKDLHRQARFDLLDDRRFR